MYGPIIILAKASVCLQCLRLFAVGRDKAFWTIHIFLFVNFSYYAAAMIVDGIHCGSVAENWNPAIPGKCIDGASHDLSTGPINLVSDLLMLLYPLVRVWRLQMSHTKKREAYAIFLIAVL